MLCGQRLRYSSRNTFEVAIQLQFKQMCEEIKIEVFKVDTSTIPTVLHFMHDYYEIEGLPFKKNKKVKTIETLIKNPSIGKIYLIRTNEKEIGYFCIIYGYSLEYDGRDCFLDEIYLDPNYRGIGIGSKVLKKIESILRNEDIKAIRI